VSIDQRLARKKRNVKALVPVSKINLTQDF
jgi:hypothetical protein